VRTVYLGTSDFAAAVLQRLAASPHRPTLAVTRPDRPRGRGRRLQAPPVADTARELGIELFQPESVNDEASIARIDAARAETLLVCAYGALIKEPLLSRYPILNVHPSLLPRWRGAAPVERAIMAGDDETGISIMRLTAGLDSGPVGLQRIEPIRPDDTYGTLSARLCAIGGDLLVAALDHPPAYREQDESKVTYAEKIEPADRVLDPTRSPIELEWVVRALTPHIGARIERPGGDPLGVRAARASYDEAEPGELRATEDGRLVFGATGGSLELLEVQPPGKTPMAAADYLRGHPLG
jgi:methionyl-tRNA formyltransferase